MRKTKIDIKDCVYCQITGKKIDSENMIMVAIEKPYINLWMHKECFNSLNWEDLRNFLQETIHLWYN